jgi:hypothetical protein
MKRTIALLTCLFAASTQAAEPILIPEFTPVTPAEFASAVMIQSMVVDQLTADGHILLTEDIVSRTVGAPSVRHCSSNAACPIGVLPKLPARIAVVVRIGRDPNGLVGHLELYEQSNPAPVVVRDVPLPPGGESALVNEVSAATAWLVSQVGPSSDAVVMAAARMIAGEGPSAAPPPTPVSVAAPLPVPVRAPIPVPLPVPAAPIPPPTARPAPQPTVAALGDETGVYPRHIAGSEDNYSTSDQDPRDWVYENMPHAGRVAFEMRAGIAMGDTDRGADMRVDLKNAANEVSTTWYQEGPASGRRPRGGIFLGYAPSTFIDVGALLGFQYGERLFTTGYHRIEPESLEFDKASRTVTLLQVYFQPRVRGYLVPLGPAKPFVFTGMEVLVFDKTSPTQPDSFSYPVVPGGTVPGWVGGGGIMIDPSPIVGFLFEASYTQHFGPRASTIATGTWQYESLAPRVGVQYSLGLIGGAQFRI